MVTIAGFYFQTKIFPQSITFNHLTVENGLSNNDVNTIIQDQTGFIWFGTDDGLNRYDGYNFKVFRHIMGILPAFPIIVFGPYWKIATEIYGLGPRAGY